MPIGDPPDRLYADTLHVCIMREVGEGRPPPLAFGGRGGEKRVFAAAAFGRRRNNPLLFPPLPWPQAKGHG